MRILLTVCVVVNVILCGCKKTDPENNPEYIGKWKSYDTSSSLFSNYSDIIVFISADGTAYDTWGGGASGKCKITKNYIKIGDDRKHKIIREPYAVPLFTLEESFYDTVRSSIKMRIGVDGGAWMWGYRETDFYKVD